MSNESYSSEDVEKLSNWEAKCISEAPVKTADQIAQCIQNQRRGYANMPQLRNGGAPIVSQNQLTCVPSTPRANCLNAVRSISETENPHELNSSDRALIVANCRAKCNIETGSVELQIRGCNESVKNELDTYLSSYRQRCSFPDIENNSEISDSDSNDKNADDSSIDEPVNEAAAEPASSPTVQTQINLCRANRSGQCATILDGGIAFTSAPITLPSSNGTLTTIGGTRIESFIAPDGQQFTTYEAAINYLGVEPGDFSRHIATHQPAPSFSQARAIQSIAERARSTPEIESANQQSSRDSAPQAAERTSTATTSNSPSKISSATTDANRSVTTYPSGNSGLSGNERNNFLQQRSNTAANGNRWVGDSNSANLSRKIPEHTVSDPDYYESFSNTRRKPDHLNDSFESTNDPKSVGSNETEFESGEMMSTLSSLSSNSIRNNTIANNGRVIASQPGNLSAIGDKSSVKNLSTLINTITFGFFSRTEDLEEDGSKQRGSSQSQISKKKRKKHIKDCGMDLRCIANYISSKAKKRHKGRSLASVRKNQFENIWVSNTDILTHMHDVYGSFHLDHNGGVIP